MAEKAFVRLPGIAQTSAQRRREDQLLRKNLRIAIRQLERAELYLDAIDSLNLDDDEVDRTVRRIVGNLQALRRYLSARRAMG
jgi:outer membrane PBP1 activator LpoA protein